MARTHARARLPGNGMRSPSGARGASMTCAQCFPGLAPADADEELADDAEPMTPPAKPTAVAGPPAGGCWTYSSVPSQLADQLIGAPRRFAAYRAQRRAAAAVN